MNIEIKKLYEKYFDTDFLSEELAYRNQTSECYVDHFSKPFKNEKEKKEVLKELKKMGFKFHLSSYDFFGAHYFSDKHLVSVMVDNDYDNAILSVYKTKEEMHERLDSVWTAYFHRQTRTKYKTWLRFKFFI